jgi:aspartyl aminopeptidase|tara:strand:+ start:71 stop:1915 length:1845 start_codon:yes stop_codon:yes gene_type:complete
MKLLLSPSSSLKSGPGAAMMTAKLLLRGRRHHHQHHRVVRRIPVLVSTSSSGSNTFSDNECDCGFCPSWGMRMIKPPLSFNRIQQQQQSRYSSSSSSSTKSSSNDDSLYERKKLSTIEPPTVAKELVEYLNKSWTAFHATKNAEEMLKKAGFVKLDEDKSWSSSSSNSNSNPPLKPNGKYYVVRNQSCIVAFCLGGEYVPGDGFHIIAAHTDSPCPKLKPVSKRKERAGCIGVGVQPYGGGLWHTWFDRDLSVAGRVLLKKNDGRVQSELVKIERPIVRIPSLAIHLDREINQSGFKPNLETNFAPILATAIKAELEGFNNNRENKNKDANNDNSSSSSGGETMHHPIILAILAEELKCEPEDIIDFELNVCDTQKSQIGGATNEFIFSGRLDNLCSSFCALKALIDASKDSSLKKHKGARAIALFDNEEVGSVSTSGGGGTVMIEAIKRATLSSNSSNSSNSSGGESDVIEQCLAKSFLVSADMAHAIHPNYTEKHEEQHQPLFHKGVVVKHNANQRYATTALTAYMFRECAKLSGIPTQEFVVKNDMGCGSTIGPIVSAQTGIRTVDVGVPQLSMHSVREMMGTEDVDICHKHFLAFYENIAKVDANVQMSS